MKGFGRNLKKLNLYNSSIEVVTKDLFEFNPNLKEIILSRNNIAHIETGTFDKLLKLSSLSFKMTNCTNATAFESRKNVLKVIKEVEKKCKNKNYKSTKIEEPIDEISPESSQNFINYEETSTIDTIQAGNDENKNLKHQIFKLKKENKKLERQSEIEMKIDEKISQLEAKFSKKSETLKNLMKNILENLKKN